MRVLICGGRDFTDRARFDQVLEYELADWDDGELIVITGMAKGADTLAYEWGLKHAHKIDEYPADWEQYGRAAGHIRNQQMLDEGKPDLVIAFPGGRGTANMIERAKKAGVKVIQYSQEEDPSSTSPQS